MNLISLSSPSTLACVTKAHIDSLTDLHCEPLVDALELLELGLGHELAVLSLLIDQFLDGGDLLRLAYVFAHCVVVLQVLVLHFAQSFLQTAQSEVLVF